MKPRRNTIRIVLLLLLFTGFLCHFSGRGAASAVPAVFALSIAILICSMIAGSGNDVPASLRKRSTEVSLPALVQKQAAEEAEPHSVNHSLGRAHRRDAWLETEAEIERLLDAGMDIIRKHTRAYTVAVLFPTSDGGFMLRRCVSDCPHISAEAVIYPGVGVLGSFLKEGLKKLDLKEIVNDSATLYYYTQDAGIRSLIAHPIVAGGSSRGAVLADSRSPGNFTEDDHHLLAAMSSLLGQVIYSSYLYTEHKLQHERLAAMSSIEKEFFQDLSRPSILDKIAEVVSLALPCDRLSISMKNDDGKTATIVRVVGEAAEALLKNTFSLECKSLVPVLYANNMMMTRNFSEERYEVRYDENEPHDQLLRSFIAVPLGVDGCVGMLLVESRRENAFDDSSRELLGRLSTSAGLAIEKLLVFEKATALATHDGLTGLYNHRTFQQLLGDEITRAIRYGEPVSMVICDIDHFKKCNDTYGHPFGDIVLKGVAATLQSSVRQDIDTVARYGGEEFALILVKTDSAGAIETAERIRSAIAANLYKSPNGADVHVTMSFGIAEYKKDARQLNELIAKADKALYRAKEHGRNRVEVF